MLSPNTHIWLLLLLLLLLFRNHIEWNTIDFAVFTYLVAVYFESSISSSLTYLNFLLNEKYDFTYCDEKVPLLVRMRTSLHKGWPLFVSVNG